MATPPNAHVVMQAPAKVNLTLCVGPRRPDGYHELVSIFQAVSVCDDVVLTDRLARAGVCVTSSDPDLPTDDRNTAYRAARLLQETYAPDRGVEIHLQKRIPAQAGLGGGSSDAAAVLLGLDRLWGLRLSYQALLALATAVGSDVPFFLTGGCALVQGRGEQVQALPMVTPGWFVIAKPAGGISTARAYADLDALRASQVAPADCPPTAERMRTALQRGDLLAVAAALHNDLERVVLATCPDAAAIKQEMLAAGAVGALLCGSGSAVFGLFPTETAARAAAAPLTSRCAWVQTAAPLAGDRF